LESKKAPFGGKTHFLFFREGNLSRLVSSHIGYTFLVTDSVRVFSFWGEMVGEKQRRKVNTTHLKQTAKVQGTRSCSWAPQPRPQLGSTSSPTRSHDAVILGEGQVQSLARCTHLEELISQRVHTIQSLLGAHFMHGYISLIHVKCYENNEEFF
jgi:hypothetical protein